MSGADDRRDAFIESFFRIAGRLRHFMKVKHDMLECNLTSFIVSMPGDEEFTQEILHRAQTVSTVARGLRIFWITGRVTYFRHDDFFGFGARRDDNVPSGYLVQ